MIFLERVCRKLNQNNVKYLLVGGYAVALHGAVRATIDIDITLNWTKANLKKAEQALHSLGLTSILPITSENVFNFRDEYINNRNLIAWNFVNQNDPSEQIDLIINFDAKGKKSIKKKVGKTDIPILSIRDLIEMKKLAGREQDIQDIKSLEMLL